MRHDPAGASIVIMLRSLKLYGMANAVEDLVAQGGPAFEAATPMLSQLLKAEIAEREVRSIAYQTKVARFPSYKDLAGFDFKSSDINEATVKQLHRCEFMENAENVVLIGGPGTGKSHVATAIGVQAIEHHRRKVRFYSTVMVTLFSGHLRGDYYFYRFGNAIHEISTECSRAVSKNFSAHASRSLRLAFSPSLLIACFAATRYSGLATLGRADLYAKG